MAKFIQAVTPIEVPFGQNVPFIRSNKCGCTCKCIEHMEGTGIVTLMGGRTYNVTFGGNIAVPEGGTAAAIAVALAINGEALQGSRAIVTPAAVEQYFKVTVAESIEVPCGCCYTLAVENVNAGVGGEIVDEQTISVADGNLTVTCVA